MDCILGKRGSGKTKELMKIALKKDAIISCSNPIAMEKKARAYGLIGIDFISYWDFYNHRFPVGKKVLVDDLDIYVKTVSNDALLGYSLTTED